MIPWSLLNTFALPLGIWALRNGFAFYRSLRESYNRQKPSVRPLPPHLNNALNLLFVFAACALCYTLPWVAPQNIFQATGSRLQTPNNVLFNRLAKLRPLTPLDEALQEQLATKHGRLVYFGFGPQVLADCQFCTEQDSWSYFVHALPSLLAPHLGNLAVLGAATSRFVAGGEGARWRYQAIAAAAALAAMDLYASFSYDLRLNTRATSAQDVDFFYWRARLLRGLGILALDVGTAALLWLSGTNRLFAKPYTTAERLALVGKALEMTNFRLWATGNVRNAVVRNEHLRDVVEAYWAQEGELFEQREVVDALRGALSRLDVTNLERQADEKARQIVTG